MCLYASILDLDIAVDSSAAETSLQVQLPSEKVACDKTKCNSKREVAELAHAKCLPRLAVLLRSQGVVPVNNQCSELHLQLTMVSMLGNAAREAWADLQQTSSGRV